MFLPPRKSVLLVDFDNLVVAYGRPLLDGIANWVTWLEHGQFDPKQRRRKFVAKRVYWNSENDSHRHAFQKNRFEVQLCRAMRKEKASSADFDITIHAVELHHKHKDIKEFIILSFDTDFSSVFLHLQFQNRLSVSMIDREKVETFRDTATSKYQRMLDGRIEKEAFREAFAYTPPKWGQRRVRPKPSPPPIALAPTPPPAAPATKPSQPKFDYVAAAGLIERTAEQSGLLYIGKDRIRRIVGHLPGFTTPVGLPWAGGSYRRALSEFVRVSDKFSLEKPSNNGGEVLAYRGNGATNGNGAARNVNGNGPRNRQGAGNGDAGRRDAAKDEQPPAA